MSNVGVLEKYPYAKKQVTLKQLLNTLEPDDRYELMFGQNILHKNDNVYSIHVNYSG